MADSSALSATSSCTLPLDSALVHKYGMEFHALLTMDGPGAKKKSKVTGVAFHPVRPWVAAVESKDVGIVWNYETKEVLKRFTLQIGDDVPATSEDPAAVATPTAVAMTKSMAISSTFSPKLGGGKAKSTSVLLFFDREAISHASGIARGIDCFEEWLVILTLNNIVFCDINDSQSNRCITPDDLGRATPNSIELLPGGFLAIGCSDGKIRIWSPRLWKVCHVIDMGAIKEIPHMILVPSDAASAPTSSPSTFHCYLIAVHADGKAIVWSVNRLATAEFQQSRACEFDLKDANKRANAAASVDLTSCGFHELKLLQEDSVLTGVSKDGNVLVWDVSFLRSTHQAKEPRVNFVGVFHTSASASNAKPLHGTLLLGSSKHSYVCLSSCRTSMMNISELHKGKANQDLEIAAHRVDLVKDVRNLHAKLSKKIKINSVSQSPRNATLIAAATNYGLLLFSMHSATRHTVTLLPSAAALVLNTPTHLRSVALTEKGKKDVHALKYPNKDSVGLAIKHPASSHLAILTGSHYEIVHVDDAVNYRMIASGPGVAVAWHTQLLRFAVLVPDEDDVARRARTAAVTDSPRKKLGFFGKTEEVVATGPVLSHFFKHDVDLRPHTVALYDVDPATGMCTRVVDKLTSGQSQQHVVVHAFSGPLLGIVRCALPDEPKAGKAAAATATTPSSGVTASSVSEGTVTGSSITSGEPTSGMHVYLEFYEWSGAVDSAAPSPALSSALKKVGPVFAGPLLLAWEKAGRYGVLVYPTKCTIIKWDGSSTVSLLHEIRCTRPIQSVLWVHHTLFTATEDEIKCYFICGSRTFSFVIASTTTFHDHGVADDCAIELAEFPVAQRHPGGPLKLLGVHQEQLFLGGLHQSIYSIELKNPVLQFCMFVAQGLPKRALEVVPTISDDLLDWLATFLEAFGFAADALQVQGTSLHLRASICIKHMLVHTLADLVPSLVASTATDSVDVLGTSLMQRACAALCRGGQDRACVALFPACMQANKWNDALFVAMLVKDKALMAQALVQKRDLGHALYTSKKSADVEGQWNHQLDVYTTTHGVVRPVQFAGAWS